MQELAKGRGVVVSYYPSGPLIEYAPSRVPTPPTTADELLAWAKQNPKKLIYARPANSGPGRTFLMGLPYLLGDSNPKDPMKGWDKTWAYLKELDKTIEYYPDRHRGDDEGVRRGHARHAPHDDRAGTSIRACSASFRRTQKSGRSRASTGSSMPTTSAFRRACRCGARPVIVDLIGHMLKPESRPTPMTRAISTRAQP